MPLSSTVSVSGLDFGDFSAAEVLGRKVIDLNGDSGITGDTCGPTDAIKYPGCAGVTVTLSGTDGQGDYVSLTTSTDGNGDYSFTNLWPGTYAITVTEPAGFICSYPDPCTYTVDLSSDDVVTGQDFGDLSLAEVHGRKAIDLNGDGVIAGDTCSPTDIVNHPGCAGVTVNLSGTDGMGRPVDLSAQTDANGNYSFTDLWPGSYTVTIEDPAGFDCSYPDPCIHSAELVSDAVIEDLDFGDFQLARISGSKFEDVNENHVYDPGADQPIDGWPVYLLNAAGNVVGSVQTVDGKYSFNVLLGTNYPVCEFSDPEWRQSYPVLGGSCLEAYADDGYAISLPSGGQYEDADFGNIYEGTAEFVPEPGTIALLGSGLVGLAGYAALRLRSLRPRSLRLRSGQAGQARQALRWRTRE